MAEGAKQKRLEYALKEYADRNVSLGRAAELAKMPLSDFMTEAAKRQIPINYSKESLQRDFEAAFGQD